MGKLGHWEIPATNVKKSAEFYKKLFGWKMQSWSPDYTLFEVKGGIGGGISQYKKVPKPCIQVYVTVRDIPASLKKAVKLGAKVVRPKTAIGSGMGFFAQFDDPQGCRIGLWAAK